LDGRPAAGIALSAAALQPDEFEVDRDRAGAQWGNVARVVPDRMAAQLYRARTDAAGSFTLSGLPRDGKVTLQAGDGLMLAPGSAQPIELRPAAETDAGIMIAVRPARIQVRVLDQRTGRPAPQVEAQVASEAP